jgi:hypothetical protein
MSGEFLQGRMPLPSRIHCLGQVAVQALDRHGDGPDALLRAVPAAPWILAQELQDVLPLLPRLGLHRRARQFVFQHGLKPACLAAQASDHFRVIQAEAALLNAH